MLVFVAWKLDERLKKVYRFRTSGFVDWMPDAGCRMPDTGYRMPDTECRMPDTGCQLLGTPT